jgi:TonB family protein
MRDDRAFKITLFVSICIHAACIYFVSVVIVADLGRTASPMEFEYVGRAGSSGIAVGAAPVGGPMPPSPAVNLPDRGFAEGSVVSGPGDDEVGLPVRAEKVDMMRNYLRGGPAHIKLDIPEPAEVISRPIGLSAEEEFTVEGKLAGRKIVMKPPTPDYPEWALKSGYEVDMKVRITVSPRGLVEEVESIESGGSPRMNLVASKYIRQWRFEGRAGDSERESGVISIKFRLK